MVKVWFVREGPEPTRGGLSCELPLETGIKTLGLSADRASWQRPRRAA